MRFPSLSLLAALPLLGLTLSAHATSIAGTYNLEGVTVQGYTVTGQVTILASGYVQMADLTYNDPAFDEENNNKPLSFTSVNNYYDGNGYSGSQIYSSLGQVVLYFDTTAMGNGDLLVCLSGSNAACGGSNNLGSSVSAYKYYNGSIPPYGMTIPAAGGNFTAGYLAPASVAVSPEPSSLVLLGTGLIGAAGAMRRRFLKA